MSLHTPQPHPKPKVFYLGFHKTGTSSVGDLLGQLGYRVCGPHRTRDETLVQSLASGDLTPLQPALANHDAFQDNPWPLFFREWDARFPGSRFLFFERDPLDWYASMLNHFGKKETPMRELIYGIAESAPFQKRRGVK